MPPLPRRLVEAVIERDGGFCLLALPGCQGRATLAHHRANRGMGSSRVLDHPANLCAADANCNQSCEDAGAITRLDLIERGLRVEKAATNTATLERAKRIPVQGLDGRWWVLVDEHTRTETYPEE